MDYVKLGGTGLEVSRICLGTMTYGTPEWRPWVLDENASRPFLRRALDAGINFFDTADMYSRGVSEEVVVEAFGKAAALRRSEKPGVVNEAGADVPVLEWNDPAPPPVAGRDLQSRNMAPNHPNCSR